MQATQKFPTELLLKAQNVRLAFLDVDGVFTDGGLYMDGQGESIKRFHTLDGMGLQLLKEAGVKLPLELTLSLPPTPYALTDRALLVDALAKVGIQVKSEYLTWPQWLSGPFKGQFDLTMINHVEPLDYPIYADPQYYFGYDSQAFRDLEARHSASSNARERQTLFADMQRHLANDAVNAWIFASQITAISRKGLKGWWMNYPIFVHDVAALRWE